MGGPTQLPLPAATGALIPAAAYVRMSTEHQQYSTENQLDRIKEYAARRRQRLPVFPKVRHTYSRTLT